MEEIIEFDTFIKNYVPPTPRYEAIYNDDGIVISICPKGISDHVKNKIDIDLEIVEQIHSGNLQLNNCFVDLNSGSIEITRQEYLKKIDDLFHRIPEKKFVGKQILPDVEITYSKKAGTLTFSMSENIKSKKIRWAGDTILNFYVTNYNDPHVILQKINLTIDELYKSDAVIQIDVEERFSIFTIRLLKNYVLNIKK